MPPSRRDAAGVLIQALTAPESLDASHVGALADFLARARGAQPRTEAPATPEGGDHADARLSVAAVAAVLYSRPELADAALIDQIGSVLEDVSTPAKVRGDAARVLQVAGAGPLASSVWTTIRERLAGEAATPEVRRELLTVLRELVDWHEEIVGLDEILALAGLPQMTMSRSYLLDHGVELFVSRQPSAFTCERLGRMAALFGSAPRYPYVMYALAAHPGLDASARTTARELLDGCFPLHADAASLLHDGPVHVFVALNVGMGQGDDVVRVGPLLQALLDANPALRVTLATLRTYLYDHPRVKTIPVADDDAVQAALAEQPDAVVEFFQPGWRDFTFRPEMHERIARHLAEARPRVVITGDLGRACDGREGMRSQFLHQSVVIDGHEHAAARALDRPSTVASIYDPGMRLIAELGLPLRAGEQRAASGPLLTGTPSSDAERVWAALVGDTGSGCGRPVALLNPYGGSGATKGFFGQQAMVAAEVAGLVDEGFLVVLLPNGQEWARSKALAAMIADLDPGVRNWTRLAPDPAEEDDAARLLLDEREALPYSDRVMRLFKYFASYADLVATVEGWLAHLAYALGRPFRLLSAAGSFCSDWFPRDRGPGQRLVTSFSPRSQANYAASDLLGDGGLPPLPHRPRKYLLEVALAGLGDGTAAEAVPPLRRAMTSLDPDIRTWAIMALGRMVPVADRKHDLLAALKDGWPSVVREAATALVRAEVDCSRELGPRYRELLEVELAIARQDWPAVAAAGPAALPALFRAGRCDYHDVRHGAKVLLRDMVAPFIRRAASDGHSEPEGHARISSEASA